MMFDLHWVAVVVEEEEAEEAEEGGYLDPPFWWPLHSSEVPIRGWRIQGPPDEGEGN